MKHFLLAASVVLASCTVAANTDVNSTAAVCRYAGYIDNGDGTVTDPRNGLMMAVCALGQKYHPPTRSCLEDADHVSSEWAESANAARKSRLLGHSDWRLPSKAEMNQISGGAQCHGKRLSIMVFRVDAQRRSTRPVSSFWLSDTLPAQQNRKTGKPEKMGLVFWPENQYAYEKELDSFGISPNFVWVVRLGSEAAQRTWKLGP